MIKDGKIAMVINTTESGESVTDSFSIRRTALLGKVPYYTTIAGAKAIASAISAINSGGGLDVRSIQSYFATSK
jgi:carbamoyl-phosphate synthase large subunit